MDNQTKEHNCTFCNLQEKKWDMKTLPRPSWRARICCQIDIQIHISQLDAPVPPLVSCVSTRIKIHQALFGCSRIRINPHMLGWIGVEIELNSTSIHSNTCGLKWIRQHPNKASAGCKPKYKSRCRNQGPVQPNWDTHSWIHLNYNNA